MFKFPYWQHFAAALEPILEEVRGAAARQRGQLASGRCTAAGQSGAPAADGWLHVQPAGPGRRCSAAPPTEHQALLPACLPACLPPRRRSWGAQTCAS